jgi:hypothetical protein
LNVLSDQTLAYLAALIDGEGCVTIRCNRNRGEVRALQSYVEIANTRLDLLYWIREQTGVGSIFVRTPKPSHKPVGHWVCSGPSVMPFLAAVRPWLRLKDVQADLVAAFQATKGRGSARVSSELMARRLHFVTQIRALNQRGVKEPICLSPSVSNPTTA